LNSTDLLSLSPVSLLLVGAGIGVLGAVLGIGGGLLMVPALTYWGASPVQAVATSLVGVVLSSASGSYRYWRVGQLHLERVALLAPTAMLATELGVWIANSLPSALLLLGFAILQALTIYLMSLKSQLAKRQSSSNRVGIYQSEAIGLVAGVLSGLFGVGGGVVMTPLQMLFLGESIKDAIRNSLGAVTLISLWALGRHALSGNVLWITGLCLGLGGLGGAQLGARLLPKLPDRAVSLLFRSLLLILAVYMASQAVSDWV
jgi:uncharacterized protein